VRASASLSPPPTGPELNPAHPSRANEVRALDAKVRRNGHTHWEAHRENLALVLAMQEHFDEARQQLAHASYSATRSECLATIVRADDGSRVATQA
jgi:hypothetical protein